MEIEVTELWTTIARSADIITIVCLPVTLVSLWKTLYDGISIYDSYREMNEAGGWTYSVNAYTRRDRRRGKKENPERQYHRKGKSGEGSWE